MLPNSRKKVSSHLVMTAAEWQAAMCSSFWLIDYHRNFLKMSKSNESVDYRLTILEYALMHVSLFESLKTPTFKIRTLKRGGFILSNESHANVHECNSYSNCWKKLSSQDNTVGLWIYLITGFRAYVPIETVIIHSVRKKKQDTYEKRNRKRNE